MSRSPADSDKPREDVTEATPLIRPGGKVDPEAVRTLAEAEGGADDDGLARVRFTLTRDLNKRLDKYLTDRITFMSRTQLQRLIDVGGVTVNGRTPKAATRLRLGDTIEAVIPPPPPTEIQGQDIPLEILFEDDHLVVVNKQPDLIVHPARSHHSGTLLNALVWHFQHGSGEGGSLSGVGKEAARPGVVHRLDRHTSGVMVVAKDDEAHWNLGRQFEQRRVEKRYLAVVEGEVDALADEIDRPIGPHPSKAKGLREKMVVRQDALGKPARTICRVRQRYRGFTLIELELLTGRTHQIRVHMSARGFPLVGDDMYGGRILREKEIEGSLADEFVMPRQALHAALLAFHHPQTGKRMTFTAPVWDDMARLIRLLRTHRDPGDVLAIPGCGVDLAEAIVG